MSKKKKEETNQNTSTTQTLNPFSQNLLTTGINNSRQLLADNPFQAFEGERVAGLNDTQQQAQAGFQQHLDAGNPLLAQAGQAAQDAGGFRPEQITAQSFAGADLSAFQNPFQQQVIDATTSELDRSHSINQNNNRGAAARAGAFGGDRHAIVESEANRNHEDLRARTVSQLQSDGFNSAANLFQQDANRQLTADTTNANLGLQGAQLGLEGASLQAQLGQFQQQNALSNAQQLNAFGTQQQDVEQRGLDAAYQEQLREQEDFYQRLQAELGITGLTPILTNTTGVSNGTTTSSSSNPLGTIGTVLSGAALLSDKRLKRDIRYKGKRKGHKWYEFKYLWSDELQEGVMAQEVIKTRPDAISWVRGFMAVDYDKLGLA